MFDLFTMSPVLFAGVFAGTLVGVMISIGANQFLGITSGLDGAAIIAACLLGGLFSATLLQSGKK